MWTSGSGLLVGILTVPAIVATLAFGIGQRAPRRFGEAGAITAAAGFLAAAALAEEDLLAPMCAVCRSCSW